MGYLFSSATRSRKEVVEELKETYGERMVDYSLVGSDMYTAIRRDDGVVTIVVFLIRSNSGSYGFKAIDEAAHPYYYKCPEKIIKLSTNPDGVEWRLQCRVQRRLIDARKQIISQLTTNSEIETRFGKVAFSRFYNKSKTQFVARNDEGKVYRYPIDAIQVADSVIEVLREECSSTSN